MDSVPTVFIYHDKSKNNDNYNNNDHDNDDNDNNYKKYQLWADLKPYGLRDDNCNDDHDNVNDISINIIKEGTPIYTAIMHHNLNTKKS